MRLTSSRAYHRPPPVPKMPPGLVEMMDGLARDVLMHNPANVYEFCANHMEKLLEIRDGPSSKKSPTLEQKIINAQEKMRQKAQERREKFDKEIKLLSNDDMIDIDNRDISLVPEELAITGPSIRVPLHHEVDLKNASEVEISHVPQVENATLSELTNITNIDKIDHAKDVIIDNVAEAESQIHEIMDEQHGQDKETESNKKLDDEQIFGKVDKEVIKVDLLKTQEEIVDMAAIEPPLQTITEASEETFVNDNGIILPKITIGDDGLDPDNISDESGQEIQDVAEYKPEKSSEFQNTHAVSNLNDIAYNNFENEIIVSESTPEQKINTSDLVHDSEKDTGVSTLVNEEKPNVDTGGIPEITDRPAVDIGTADTNSDDGNLEVVGNSDPNSKVSTETHNNDSLSIIPPADATEDIKDSHDEDLPNELTYENTMEVKQPTPEVLIENSNLTVKEATQDLLKNDAEGQPTAEVLIKHANVSEKEAAQDLLKNEATLKEETNVAHENITTENEDKLKEIMDVEHVIITSENEANLEVETDVEQVNMTKIHNTDSNIKSIDAANVEYEIIQPALKAGEDNLGTDFEKYQDNADISLQKSESTENTNEDSISMVESDLSKTDDDSTQNNPNMDLETAAVTIQKVFRSFMFKSRNSTFEDNTNDDRNSVDEDNDKKEEYYAAANLTKERRPLGITRMDTVLQTVNEEKSLSLSTDDSSTLSSAATTIQAHVRGFLVRNRLNSSKTFSMNSLVNSHEVLEADPEQHKNKTILNIHIVPEEGNYLSRDESFITSMDLSLDGSPPSSVNLHPLSCDISERRKMLKREDAVQSVSPPSNNSGKLSEDSVKEVLNENGVLEREPTDDKTTEIDDLTKEFDNEASDVVSSSTVTPTTIITISKSEDPVRSPRENSEADLRRNGTSLTKLSSDESDVITPFVPSPRSSGDGTKLVHSGEFHDVVLPTKVSRNDTSAVRGE